MGSAVSSSLRASLDAYSRSFVEALEGSLAGGGVCSPLGAWLLLALLAPAVGAGSEELAAQLGLPAEEAALRARALLESDQGDYLAALAVWSNVELRSDWLDRLPAGASRGAVPVASGLDKWATEATRGLIESYPNAEQAAEEEILLATALSARTLWKSPFDQGEVLWGVKRVDGLYRDCLESLGERAGVARVSGSELAFADIVAEDESRVLLVIGEEGVGPAAVLAAAHEIAATLDGAGTAELLGRDDLPVGRGHSWELREDASSWACTEITTVPFELSSSHRLEQAPGFKELSTTSLSGLTASGHAEPVSAQQAAVARFHSKGFEAAALTSMLVASASMGYDQRLLSLSFSRPFGFVARDRDGLPWFAGWVNEPAAEPRAEEEW